ncbi:MAG: ectoine/hydroxyectoine ABC transporter substrate-binding protein EhuB [Candidatus Hydrogenedentota bacterium]
MSQRIIRRLSRAVAAAFLIGAILPSCGGSGSAPSNPDESTLDRIQRTGTIRVGYANEAPYAYVDSSTGKLTGEAPEVLRAVMSGMGVNEVEGVLTEFGSLIPGLKAKRFDVIAAGMYITPERCEQIAFSNPSYTIGEAFVVKAGNPLALHSYEDIAQHESATLGVVAGTVERGYARSTGIPDDRVIVFPDPPSALAGVVAGRVDAYAGTSLTIQDLMSKSGNGKLERAEPFTDPVIEGETIRGYGAFGFRNDDAAFREAFNEALGDYIGTPDHLQTVQPFGFTESELPGDVTAEELCGGVGGGS